MSKKLKSFIVILTVCAMLTTAVPIAFSADEAEIAEEPFVLADKYAESFGLLQVLGVYTEEYVAAVNKDTILTRGEFIRDLILSMNLGEAAHVLESRVTFMDIYDSKIAGYANLAYDMGITNGTGYVKFEPDETVTVSDAAVMVMRALGYTYITNSVELQSKARQKGLLDGVEATDTLTAVDAAMLLYNALHAGSQRITKYGSETYELTPDRDWLDLYFNIGYAEGIVTATEITALNQKSEESENCIRVGEHKIYGAPDETEELLGYPVRCYYSNNDIDEYIYITSFDFDYNEEFIRAKNVESFSTASISYYDSDDKEREKTINTSADFVYNGKAVSLSEHSLTEMTKGYTHVKLLDNNGDKKIDVVFITKSETFAVDSVDTSRMRIMGKDAEFIDLDDKTGFVYRIKQINGDSVALGDIKEWNVVTVAESFDKEYAVIVVSTDSVTGAVESVTSLNATYADIDGKSFEIDEKLIDNNEIKLGENATFYMSADGVIYAVNYQAGNTGLWVYAIGIDGGSTLATDYEFGCVSGTDPEFKTYHVADRVELDGKSFKEESLGTVLTESSFPEVMIISLNENDEVSSINTIVKGDNETVENNLVKRFDGKSNSELYYSNWGRSFNTRFVMSTAANIYGLPTDETDYDDMFNMQFEHEKTYNVDLYSLGIESPVCKMAIVRGAAQGGAKISVDTGCVPFLRTSEKYDAETGETYEMLYYLSTANKETGIKISKDVKNVVVDTTNNRTIQQIVDGLEIGDIIRVVTNSRGLANIEHIFDTSEKKLLVTTREFSGNPSARFVAGQLYEVKDTYARIITSSDYNLETGEGIETHPTNADSRNGYVITIGRDGNFTLTPVSSAVELAGARQGVTDVIALYQTRYGFPITMMYIDYSNVTD
ncbi:MAG: hypothetical protein J6D26_05070 [Clostridia bacterium]|nr:hypothetical protein [Clostridia bacterium]